MARLRHHPGVAGLDEAGRGPMAGPVVAAAVILPKGFDTKGLNDSKLLARSQREELAIRIKEGSVWAVAYAEVEEIDRINILWASMAAMRRALDALPIRPTNAICDGDKTPRSGAFECEIEALVKADQKIACVAAASILAKTARDDLMRNLEHSHPGYGFASHFGYSTPEHQEALSRLGPCPIHRRSFFRVQEALQGCLTLDV